MSGERDLLMERARAALRSACLQYDDWLARMKNGGADRRDRPSGARVGNGLLGPDAEYDQWELDEAQASASYWRNASVSEVADRLSVATAHAREASSRALAELARSWCGGDAELAGVLADIRRAERAGTKLAFVRVCPREPWSCPACLAADSMQVAPGIDLGAVHMGPPGSCECEIILGTI